MSRDHLGFIQNINYLARNVHLIEQGKELLTPEAVQALTTAVDLPFEVINEDIKKGLTKDGKRKIDISTLDNTNSVLSAVHYDRVEVVGPAAFGSHTVTVSPAWKAADILLAVRTAIAEFDSAYVLAGYESIGAVETDLVISEDGTWVVRVAAAAEESNGLRPLKEIILYVSEDTLPNAPEAFVVYDWYKTSSSILLLGQSLNEIGNALLAAEKAARDSESSAISSANSADASELSAVSSEDSAIASELSRLAAELAQSYAEQEAAAALASADASAVSAGEAATSAAESEVSNQSALAAAGRAQANDDRITGIIDDVLDDVAQANVNASEANDNAAIAVMAANGAVLTANGIADTANLALVRASDALALIEEVTDDTPLGPVSWHEQVTLRNTVIPDMMNGASYGPSLTIGSGLNLTIGNNSNWTII